MANRSANDRVLPSLSSFLGITRVNSRSRKYALLIRCGHDVLRWICRLMKISFVLLAIESPVLQTDEEGDAHFSVGAPFEVPWLMVLWTVTHPSVR